MTTTSLKNIFKIHLKSFYPNEEIESFFYLLMEFRLQLKRVDLALNPHFEISKENEVFFTETLEKLKKEIPIQYIIGETEFYGLPFYVNENTLIPRPETEELVDWIINEIKEKRTKNKEESIRIIDIGTGTGCIAISLAKNIQKAKVSAIDVSKEALSIAQKNAITNKVEIQFIHQDILKTIDLQSLIARETKESPTNNEITSLQTSRNGLKFDIIVSNPPYVRELEKQEIKNNVLNHEPHVALFVEDNNPLIFYDKIAELAKNNLTENGLLFFEINQYLGKETVELLKNKGFKNIELRKDIFGNDRMIKANFN